MEKVLVVGASGITGQAAARAALAQHDWTVDGLSRRPPASLDGVTPVLADLHDREATADALRGKDYTVLFYCTWARQETEAENREVNGAMLRNALDAASADGTLRHVALVTGLKHYLGPFEAYGRDPHDTPFHEGQERLPFENFYYDQEDILFATAEREGFGWSVHRPHTVIGFALGNVMNMGVTLAVYGAICRELGRPFVFPGSPQQWNGVTDLTDADLLGEHLVWAATTPAARDQALNIVNGDHFRWRRMWGVVADSLGVTAAPYPGEAHPLEVEMAEMGPVWDRIVARYDLQRTSLAQLASWWHTDGDLGREMETFADMTKSWRLGFPGFRRTDDSFRSLHERLRAARIIPPR